MPRPSHRIPIKIEAKAINLGFWGIGAIVLRTVGIMSLFLAGAFSCASQPTKHEILQQKRDAGRPRAAAYAADGFYPEKPLPERGNTPPPERFFFKKCSLTGRHPYPSSTDWQCSDPY